VAQLPAGLGIGAAGELDVSGLGWLGARVYDPVSHGFLSVDPFDPVPGAGWAGNPYSYAGNDPLHALDPTGLRPVTDAELAAYAAANNGALAAAGEWVKDNWEYVAGGAMVIAGGVLVATGVGGPAGMMLIAAGADTIIQKATTGEVNWGQVAVSGALGGFGGASIAARAGLTGAKAAVVAGVSSGGISGGVMGGYQYMTGPGPHTPGGFAQATAYGTGAGALTGGVGGGAGHAIGGRIMGALTHNPQAGTMTMGRFMETRVIPYSHAHDYGYYLGTPQRLYTAMDNHLPDSVAERANMWINEKWINYQMIEGRNLVDIGMPDGWTGGTGPYYGMELDQVQGYAHYSQDIQPANDLR
jgi:RHS repeat-associated protein